MRDPRITREFYTSRLGFHVRSDYGHYLMLEKDGLELHFFLHKTLNPLENDGQVYIRTAAIETHYESLLTQGTPIHPNGKLEIKPWGQREFSLLDPDYNLLTFGEGRQ
jgi:catechol 2,3-dioxygenase-like lactoylglutathione lyase family enzyme